MAPITYTTLLLLGSIPSILARATLNPVNQNSRDADDIQYCGSLDTPAFETSKQNRSTSPIPVDRQLPQSTPLILNISDL